MQKIYVDVSELLANGLHTGIQRVVRRIATGSIGASKESNLQVIPVVAAGGNFFELSELGRELLLNPSQVRSGPMLTADSKSTRSLKRVLSVSPWLYHVVQKWYFQKRIRGPLSCLYQAKSIDTQRGDKVVLLDSFWTGSSALEAAENARARGASIAAVIYDMIPVSHPSFCDPRLVYVFSRTVRRAIGICESLLTISKSSKEIVSAFAIKSGRTNLPVQYFYLGHNVNANDSVVPNEQNWPRTLWDRTGRVHLMVGTIEPRKGHAVVLKAFEELWKQGRDDKLLILGKIGWHVQELIARCETHPENGRKLFLVHDASDAMLKEAFLSSDDAIIASVVEGFGLPLVEALSTGLPVLASDIDVFREIAGDTAFYFAVNNPADLARVIKQAELDDSELRRKAADFRWLDWDDAVKQFLDGVLADTKPQL